MQIKIKRLTATATLPRYMTDGAAGMDLCTSYGVTVWPGCRAMIGTGIAVEIPPGYEGQIRPRSGLAKNFGVTVGNAPGTIDSDYRSEVCVLIQNNGQDCWRCYAGDRVAQMVIAPVVRAEVVEVPELSATERGAGGFGHTGNK
jgi:dUTP pyrophosphatase